MMDGLLVINEAELAAIAELRAFAAANIKDVAGVLAASEWDMAAFRDAMKAHAIALPVGYHICYSHERQPKALPPGIRAHISISVDRPGKLASPVAVNMILSAFGMRPFQQAQSVWVEDIGPGERAVNVVQLLEPGAG